MAVVICHTINYVISAFNRSNKNLVSRKKSFYASLASHSVFDETVVFQKEVHCHAMAIKMREMRERGKEGERERESEKCTEKN